MNAAVVKRTQEALGKVIRRPPLTEKLLSKPPFRYLHDIITEVIRTTGFMKGLYTDAEMKSDNVKDKDAKISFLQKAIDVVVMVSGEPLSAKPARIVAGHEPERTNELLQKIGKCCLNKSSSSGEVSKKLSNGSFKDSKAETETEVSTKTSMSMTTKTSKRRPKTSMEGDSPSDTEGETVPVGQEKSEVSESSAIPSEPPSRIRRLSRPGSARPAPPRVKRQDSVEVLTADRIGSGKAVSNVIVESQNSDNEEDEQFMVEAAPQLSETAELDAVQAVELEEDEKHGGLVKKILETKKDYEKLQLSPKPGEKEKLPVFESAWKKEKDIVSKEIEKLRASIQTLCKSALPLGKTMDYLQEDVDAMQHELQLWHSENKRHAEALREEQSITDGTVEPLRAQLVELEQLIKDQQDKICAVKANILRNEEKIQKMVYSINLSSRR